MARNTDNTGEIPADPTLELNPELTPEVAALTITPKAPAIGSLYGMPLIERLTEDGFIRFQDGAAMVSLFRRDKDGQIAQDLNIPIVNFAGLKEAAIKKQEAGLDPAREIKGKFSKVIKDVPASMTEGELLDMVREMLASRTPMGTQWTKDTTCKESQHSPSV